MTMKALAVSAAALLVLGSVAECERPGGEHPVGPGGKKKVTLTLNWEPYGEHAPFFYGMKKGFYGAEGIQLEIKSGGGSGKTIEAVASSQTEFGWAETPPLISGVNAGMKVKSVGVFLQKSPASIEFFAHQNITTPDSLRGRSIAATPGDAMYEMFPAWLQANGLAPSDVRVVNVSEHRKIKLLTEGKVDAVMGSFHNEAPTIESTTGRQVAYLLYADSGINLLNTGLVVNQAMLREDPKLVKGFVRATQKSWVEAVKNIRGAAETMAQMTDQRPAKEVLAQQLKLAVPLLRGAPGVNSEADWSKTINLMARHAGLNQPGPPSKYWDSAYAGRR